MKQQMTQRQLIAKLIDRQQAKLTGNISIEQLQTLTKQHSKLMELFRSICAVLVVLIAIFSASLQVFSSLANDVDRQAALDIKYQLHAERGNGYVKQEL